MNLKKLKSVTFSESIQQSPEYINLAQKATEYLDNLLEGSTRRSPRKWGLPPVFAEWDRGMDESGRSVLTLHIWDDNAEARTRFTPDELKMPPIRDHRLWRVWDDLLREDIDKRLRALLEDGDDAGD